MRSLIVSWYDLPLAGFVAGAPLLGDEVWGFESIAVCPDELEDRVIYALYPIAGRDFEELVSLASIESQPRWPLWVVPGSAHPNSPTAFDIRVNEHINQRKPSRLIVSLGSRPFEPISMNRAVPSRVRLVEKRGILPPRLKRSTFEALLRDLHLDGTSPDCR